MVAAARAVFTYIRPASVAEPAMGIYEFAACLFEEGQIIPATGLLDITDYLPSAADVRSSSMDTATAEQKYDREIFVTAAKHLGDRMSSDGIRKKRTGIKCFEMTLQYLHIG
jgi:hypothetical protein